MNERSNFCCDVMYSSLKEGELGVIYIDKYREYGIEYRDGGSSYQVINFCPWCGKSLPTSLRDEWFDELDRLGIDFMTVDMPSEFESSSWWKKQNI